MGIKIVEIFDNWNISLFKFNYFIDFINLSTIFLVI